MLPVTTAGREPLGLVCEVSLLFCLFKRRLTFQSSWNTDDYKALLR